MGQNTGTAARIGISPAIGATISHRKPIGGAGLSKKNGPAPLGNEFSGSHRNKKLGGHAPKSGAAAGR